MAVPLVADQICQSLKSLSLSLSQSLSLSLNVIPFSLLGCLIPQAAFICYHYARPLRSSLSQMENFIAGQNEREETTQDTIVTKSAACASYEIHYVTYITATYTRAKRRWHGAIAHAPPEIGEGPAGRP
jgi:hypothetical protein